MKTTTKNVMQEHLPNHGKFAFPIITLQLVLKVEKSEKLKNDVIQQYKKDLLTLGPDLSEYFQFQDLITDAMEKGEYEKIDTEWDELCCRYLFTKQKDAQNETH